MGQFTHNGVVYEELPNGKAKVVGYANPLAGATPIGGADPSKQLGIRQQQADLGMIPLERQGKGLSNQKTAQQIQQERFGQVADLKKQFDADSRVKAYRETLPQAVKAMSAPDTAAGDLSIVYAFGKVMDPGSAVREGEQAMAQQTAGLLGQLQSYLGMVKSGKRIPADARRNLVDAIRGSVTQFEAEYAEARDEFQVLAQQGNIDPEQVIGKHAGAKFNDLERQFAGLPTSGETQTQIDPKATATLDSFVKRAAPFNEANQWAVAQGGDPLDARAYAAAVKFAKANPNYSGSLAEFTRTTPTTPVQQALGSLVGPGDVGYVKGFKEAWDRAAVLGQDAFNAIPGLPNDNSATQAQQETQQFFQDKAVDPTGETLGRLSGATLFSAPLRSPAAAGAAGNVLMTDSTGLGMAGDAAIGAGGGIIGDRVIRGVAGMFAPQGRDAMMRLNQQGVTFSPGQMIGGRARALEDRLTANPVLGPRIDAIREQGLEQANRILPNRALAPIGQQLPDNVPAGHAAVDYTRTQLGNAYDNALNGQQIGLDPTYVTRLNAIGQRARLRPQELNELGEIVQREIGGAFQETGTPLGSMSGRGFKEIDERIGDMVTGFNASDDPYRRQLGGALADVRDQTRALARRQNPQMGQRLRQADEGYADFSILRRAAQSNPATGIFTPGQLRTAVRANDRSVGKGATARGAARAQDLASDMSETMPSTVGSSGTSEREQVNKLAPWAIGSLMSPLYSEASQQAIAKLLLRQPGPEAQRIANIMRSLPRGMFGGGTPLLIESGFGN